MLEEIIGLCKEKPVTGAERERLVDPGPNLSFDSRALQ
jgi:hypothetical protein